MNAVVSGQAGVALLLDGDKISSLRAGRPGEVIRRSPGVVCLLLGDAKDLQFLEGVELEEVSSRLERASEEVDALHLALILLDESLEPDTRSTAAEELDEMLGIEGIQRFVENILHAHPLPRGADLTGARSLCPGSAELVLNFLERLGSLQGVITEVHFAWEQIPEYLFDGKRDRAYARSIAAREGLFRSLVAFRDAGRVDDSSALALHNEPFRGLREHSEILHAWLNPLRADQEKSERDEVVLQAATVAESRQNREDLQIGELIGESRSFTEMLATVQRVAGLSIPVLIHGERGTGKELVARAIHRNSPRSESSFVCVNLGAIPEELMASELFGHVKGAFSDAVSSKQGFFAAADGGTLFLEDIGESSTVVQPQLLRFLETGEVRPMGSATSRRVNTRVVAATRRDLSEAVSAGRLREDLFYRLSVFTVRVPPLRERPEDIHLLANHFLARFTRELGKRIRGFSSDALRVLEQYEWPGNVRELQNVVERAAIIGDGGEIRPEDIHLGTQPGAKVWSEAMADFERAYILDLLRKSGGNFSDAARAAGMDARNFRKKVKAYGILLRDLE